MKYAVIGGVSHGTLRAVDLIEAFTDTLDGLLKRQPRRARDVFPSTPDGYLEETRALGRYARHKARAMDCRSSGDLPAAALNEQLCAVIYRKLSGYARW